MHYSSKIFLLFFFSIFFITESQATTVYRTYQYFNVYGKTAETLDKSLRKDGPYVEKTGHRHPGATIISFAPNITVWQDGKYCRVATAKVDVHAKIQLPKWKHANKTKDKVLATVWDTLSRDIKRHEEAHVVIARTTANNIERAVRALPVQKNCDIMISDINKVVEKKLKAHDAEQAHFDNVESINFENRIRRLLIYKLQQKHQ